MTGDQFRKIWRKRPFIPYFIRTASGESYAVNHSELAWIPPESDLVLVMAAGGCRDDRSRIYHGSCDRDQQAYGTVLTAMARTSANTGSAR